MSLRTIARAWNDFFFEPRSPKPIALFRIVLALIVLIDAAMLRADWLTWYGPRGLVSLATLQELEYGPRINVFAILPQTDFWAYAVLEGDVTLSDVATSPDDPAVEELVAHYRAGVGEHPDWDEFRAAMVRDGRVLVRLHPTRAYGMLRS